MAVYKTRIFTEDEKSDLRGLVVDSRLSNVHPMSIRYMYSHGLTSVDSMLGHLNSSFSDLKVVDMKDLDIFNLLTLKCNSNGNEITVIGDYDVDGVFATVTMIKGLRYLLPNLKINFYINDRFKIGYGLTEKTIDEVKSLYPDTKVLITVDNGISSVEAVSYANNLGLTVLITDHHKEPSILPNALGIINPKQSLCNSGVDYLCGAGVAFMCILNLANELGVSKEHLKFLLQYVAIATVCDQVPLVGFNRVFVKEGLSIINKNPSIFFKCMKEKTEMYSITEDTLGFYFGPMVNAVGRISGDVNHLVSCVLSDDYNLLVTCVNTMIELNNKRKEGTEFFINKALLAIDVNNLPKVIVLYLSGMSEGLLGVVSGSLCERFHRPVLVLSDTDSPSVSIWLEIIDSLADLKKELL